MDAATTSSTASSSVAGIKSEIRELQKLFDENHKQFQFSSFKIDEVNCKFRTSSSWIEINGNITDFYPSVAPIWFSEDATCAEIISNLKADNYLIRQIKALVMKLCEAFTCPLPKEELEELDKIATSYEEPEPEDDDDDDVEIMSDISSSEEVDALFAKSDDDEDLKPAQHKALAHLRETPFNKDWTPQATNRLQKEIAEIWRSDSVKNGIFSVELVNDSLYEWNVTLHKIDPDSALFKDLQKLKDLGKSGEILVNIHFGANYPFEPPFVRIVEPIIAGGHVLDGGAMCMELLMTQGWSSVYTAEAVILQVAATVVTGKGRVNFLLAGGSNSLMKARSGFEFLKKIPDRGREEFGLKWLH